MRDVNRLQKFALLASIALNFGACLAGAYYTRQHGGISVVLHRVHYVFGPNPTLNARREIFRDGTPSPRVVFLGDSITAGGLWDEWIPGAVNRGIEDDTSSELAERVADVAKIRPHSVWVMIGTNDFAKLTPEQVAFNLQRIAASLRQPGTAVYLQSILPTGVVRRNEWIQETNRRIRAVAAAESVQYVDLYKRFCSSTVMNPDYSYDGIHLNAAGYRLWRRSIEEIQSGP